MLVVEEDEGGEEARRGGRGAMVNGFLVTPFQRRKVRDMTVTPDESAVASEVLGG